MSAASLQRYLHEQIPLSKAMQVSVLAVSAETAVLAAPLLPNINHRDTVFGGSASAVAILAAWTLLQHRVREAGLEARLVIQRSTMDYRLPIPGDFTARASFDGPADWERFRRTLLRRGKARIRLSSVLKCDGRPAAIFSGAFVAVAPDRAERDTPTAARS